MNTSETRLEICKKCENLRPLELVTGTVQQCSICKCIMVFKTKVPQASCPIGKW